MIFDGENMFYDKSNISSSMESNVINVGPGESYQPMFLEICKPSTGATAYSCALKTCSIKEFSSGVKTLADGLTAGSYPVPRGNEGYLKLDVTTSLSTGTLTAGLVVDDDIKHRS
jgi:hypothetical protein